MTASDRLEETPAPVEAVPAYTPARPDNGLLASAIGGKRGLLDSGLPGALFVLIFVLSNLTVAIWSAVGLAVALFGWRLVRRQSVQHAVSGLFGIAVAAFVAHRMGRPEAFFLPGIWLNAVYGVVLVGSLAVRRPVIGYILAAFDPAAGEDQPGWRQRPDALRTATLATAVWAAVFVGRVAVQAPIYLAHQAGWLAATKIAMGWPLTIAAGAATVALASRARRASATDADASLEPPAPAEASPTG